jgi:hypothetical protein
MSFPSSGHGREFAFVTADRGFGNPPSENRTSALEYFASRFPIRSGHALDSQQLGLDVLYPASRQHPRAEAEIVVE